MQLEVLENCEGIKVSGQIVTDFISDPNGEITISSLRNCCGTEFASTDNYDGVDEESVCHKFIPDADIDLENYDFGAIVLVDEDGTETEYWLSGTIGDYYDMVANGQATTNSDITTLISNSQFLDGQMTLGFSGSEIDFTTVGLLGHKDTDSLYLKLEDRSDQSIFEYDFQCGALSYCRECSGASDITITFNDGHVNPYALIYIDENTGNVETIDIHTEPIIDLSQTSPETAPDLETALNNLSPSPTSFGYTRHADGSLTLHLEYADDVCLLALEMYGGADEYQNIPYFEADCPLIDYQNAIDLSNVTVGTGDNTLTLAPEFFEMTDNLDDGVYSVNIKWTDDDNTIHKDSGCVFVDCEVGCVVVERYLEDCETIVSHLYERLKDSFRCEDCDCLNSCELYERLVYELGEDVDESCFPQDVRQTVQYSINKTVVSSDGAEWKKETFYDFTGNVVTLSWDLPTNTDEINVYLNGVTQNEGDDYEVIQPNKIKFTFELEDDKVVVHFKYYG